MKEHCTNNWVRIVVLILGIIFFSIGICYQIPKRTIPYNYKEYVGGDAYNMMIEASIRGGEIAGATVAKTYITLEIALMVVAKLVKYNNRYQYKTNITNEDTTTKHRSRAHNKNANFPF